MTKQHKINLFNVKKAKIKKLIFPKIKDHLINFYSYHFPTIL